MPDYSWIDQILVDMKRFAAANRLHMLSASIDETHRVLEMELELKERASTKKVTTHSTTKPIR